MTKRGHRKTVGRRRERYLNVVSEGLFVGGNYVVPEGGETCFVGEAVSP